jgi:DNA modification methylase/superfamily II DNA or RNA helicase
VQYTDFLATKRLVVTATGREVDPSEISDALFPFQRDLVRWSLRKGRAAIFATTGMGKTRMQLEWARLTGQRCLILAPLAVARQTVREGALIGIPVTYARAQADAAPDGITITNYEMLHAFEPSAFGAVVLDESSILKNFEGKVRTGLIRAFRDVSYRLCATATPAPNDIAELANHAEFLGVMKREEMLATFFVHDDTGWRLKGHAREPFYRWLASWGMSLQRPSDLGYSDKGYDLPPLDITATLVPTSWTRAGQLFATDLKGIGDRVAVRKDTMSERVKAAADLINSEPDEPWIAWVGLNDEGRELAKLTPGSVLVEGQDSPDAKADAIERFVSGDIRVIISKTSIFGFGLNLQRCARMAFVGLSDSYEQYFQAIRRCWRFGQHRPVHAYIVLTEPEEAIYANVCRKQREAEAVAAELVKHVAAFEKAEIGSMDRHTDTPHDQEMVAPGWLGAGADARVIEQKMGADYAIYNADSSEALPGLPDASIDMAVFSPPFSLLYTYSATERDLGNSATDDQFWHHFGFISRELLRVMKPGRNVCVHVAQIPSQKAKDGVIGLKDFRGDTIRHFQQAGFIYHGEVCIDKDPQAQAIRTKSKGLLFTQMHKDSLWSRPALADYILIFRAPGESAVPVKPDITNNEWIEWARPIWYGIKETDTLNVAEGREQEDERHICPLQLGTIERCIRLWSNAGETVLTPFLGIGSEAYQAVKLGRRAVGIELKPAYFRAAKRNLQRAEDAARPLDMFAVLEESAS